MNETIFGTAILLAGLVLVLTGWRAGQRIEDGFPGFFRRYRSIRPGTILIAIGFAIMMVGVWAGRTGFGRYPWMYY